ncbi:DNA-3-methyladenine glycosylase family protein [Microbacterium excoecariae]|uniref:DNA-3-methyladenine glycosylase family protein n=1 Tax=Microbacterium excoecariae TaxID=2715210 RepID=UPI00140E818D|nr:AlkA N-terminal domain-containing protein [Microbacterium excoecariae]NHI17590.1 hypothetical protein [Microbacterium excoecariae]
MTTDRHRAPDLRISMALPVRFPFDAPGLLSWFAPRAVAGVERVTSSAFERTLRLAHGPAWFRVDLADGVRLTAELTDPRDREALACRVRRLLDLDADPLAIDAALAAHPELAPLVARTPGIRVPGASDPHEMLVRAMVGQQISVAAARTHLTRLADALGERIYLAGEERILFPTAVQIAERGGEVLRGPARRVAAILAAATALADGTLALLEDDDPEDQRRALLARPGIGPWTADYVRMRVAKDPDVILPGDLVLRAGARRAGAPADPAGLRAWAERLAPWRSYASAHFWAHALEPEG